MEKLQERNRERGRPGADETIARLTRELEQREDFRYDPERDPVYTQLRRDYARAGQQAMRDSMGQAAALTGGYASSYSQSVGQQQAEAYLQRLSDVLPELYSAAYTRYQDQGKALERRLELAQKKREGELKGEKSRREQESLQLQQAESRARYGDFSGYEALYGPEAAAQMRRSWDYGNPAAAYLSGRLSAGDYYSLTGRWPVGYQVPGSGGGYGGGGGGGGSDEDEDLRIKDRSVLKSKRP